jgi:hypothetical protein
MLDLNETIVAYDLAEALEGESGKFEITTPSGERFTLTTTPTHSIKNFRAIAEGATLQPLRVRKVAEVRTAQEVVK